MSFSKIKALYAVAVISLAVLLFVPDTFVRGTAAVFLLIGALPMFRFIAKLGKEAALTDLTADLLPQDHQDTLRSESADQDSQ